MWELTLTRTQMFHPKPGKSFVRTSADFKSILANIFHFMILSEMVRLMSFSGRDRKQRVAQGLRANASAELSEPHLMMRCESG